MENLDEDIDETEKMLVVVPMIMLLKNLAQSLVAMLIILRTFLLGVQQVEQFQVVGNSMRKL